MNDKHQPHGALEPGLVMAIGEPLRTCFSWQVLAITLAMDVVGIGIGWCLGATYGGACQCDHTAAVAVERLRADPLRVNPLEIVVKIDRSAARDAPIRRWGELMEELLPPLLGEDPPRPPRTPTKTLPDKPAVAPKTAAPPAAPAPRYCPPR